MRKKIICKFIIAFLAIILIPLEAYSANLDDLLSMANQKRRERSLDEALKLYAEALPQSRELSPYIRLYMGLIYMDKRDYNQALSYFEALWKERKNLPLELEAIVPYRIAQVYEEMEDLQRAYDFYLLSLTSGTSYLRKLAYGRLAYLAYRMEKYDKAFEWLLPILQDSPNDKLANDLVLKLYPKIKEPSSEFLYRVGRAYYLLNNYSRALDFFRRAGRGFWEGLSLERLGRKKEAFDVYSRLVKSGEVSESLVRRFAWVSESLDLKKEAIDLLIGLLRKDVQDRDMIIYYLYYLSDNVEYKKALKRDYPKSKWALRVAWFDGWKAYSAGKYKDALKEWDFIIKYHKGEIPHAKAIYYLSKVGLYPKGKAKEELLSLFPTEYYTVKRYNIPLNDKLPSFPEDRLLRRLYKVGFWEVALVRANLLEKLEAHSRDYYLSLVSEKLSNYRSSISYAYSLINSGFRDPRIWKRAYPLGDHYNHILENAKREKVDPLLVLAVIHQESRFDPDIVSWAGAIGLMQLMPFTGEAYGIKNRDLLFSPEINIKYGIKHLKEFLDRYNGNLYLSLAAYNAGPGNVDRWLKDTKAKDWEEWAESIPFQETRDYVRKVMAAYRIYKELYREKPKSKS
ncbi:MAG: lytic transglycosylase domain-containing protein [Synergistetes bacterium]|nr:lytic transglycosylase domain-containing protein [Synergistota bacterium]MCX8128419.1 lytic transglycosylase domain-containing protein [Synergistota bacterium]MDW8192903.1 lytic transglycosylase domain-containing protein [Synergistota bacterium]